MPDTLISFIRGTLAFFSLLVLTRLMGKQQVQQLNFFEYVTGITIGSIAASLTTDLHVNAAVHWVGLITWTLWTLVLGVITVHSRPMSKLIHGEPTVVIHNGKILERNLERMNYTLDDLRMQLRQKNAFNIADVEFALLEPDGGLSVLLKSQLQPVTPADLGIATPYKGLPVELVVDGRPVDANLRQLNLSRQWLIDEIGRRGHRLEQVFYAELDTAGNLYVDLRDDLEAIPAVQDITD